ncbi:MAG: PD-(D/E)XK nuclease family protein [Clostridiales bacterium]|jgi:ATP-dependent helicase/DNAse subunit B|nr:PD-(D/E)XK nuclease family protein [Clostridiales bacterium]
MTLYLAETYAAAFGNAVRAADLTRGLNIVTPDRLTLQGEKLALKALGVAGSFDIEVYGFDRLYYALTGDTGVRSMPVLQGILLTARIAAENADKFQCFSRSAGYVGFAQNVYRIISGFKAARVGPADLANGVQDAGLARKLADIALIYAEYERIKADRPDIHDRLARTADCLRDGALRGKEILYAGFDDLSRAELETALAAEQGGARVSFAAARGARIVNNAQCTMHNAQCSGHFSLSEPVTEGPSKENSPAKKEKSVGEILSGRSERSENSQSELLNSQTEIVHCENSLAEITQAAALINDYIRAGYRYRDIAVLSGDLNASAPDVARVFAGAGINFFLDKSRDLTAHPFYNYVAAGLAAVRGNFGQREVRAFLKNPFFPLPQEDKEKFENYILRFGIDRNRFQKVCAYAHTRTSRADTRGGGTFDGDTRGGDAFDGGMSGGSVFEGGISDTDTHGGGTSGDCIPDTDTRGGDMFDGGIPDTDTHGGGTRGDSFDPEKIRVQLLAALNGLTAGGRIGDNVEGILHGEAARETAQALIARAPDPETAESLRMGFAYFDGALEYIRDIYPAGLGAEDFARAFETCCRGIEINVLPQYADSVFVGTSGALRLAPPRVLIVLSANEGLYPAGAEESGLLTRADADVLKKSGIGAPTGAREAEDLAAFDALAELRSAGRAHCFYSAAGPDGTPLLRSSILNAECRMQNAEWNGHFSLSEPVMESPSKENSPAKKEKSVGELLGNAECRMQNAELKDKSNAQLSGNECHFERSEESQPINNDAECGIGLPNAAVIEGKECKAYSKPILRQVNNSAFCIPHSALTELIDQPSSIPTSPTATVDCELCTVDCKNSPTVDCSRLYFRRAAAKVSQIETFYNCPFKHFLQYGLRLAERPEAVLGAPEIGNLLHSVAELFVRRHVRRGAVAEPEARAAARGIFRELTVGADYDVYRSSQSGKNLLRRLRDEAEALCTVIARQRDCGTFSPQFTEARFAAAGDFGALPIGAGGRALFLEGRIDRVDVLEKGGERYAIVMDYKTGTVDAGLSKIGLGTNLQLPVYLAVLREAGYTPAGAFYFPVHNRGDRSYKLKGYVLSDGGIPFEMDSSLAASGESAVSEGVKLKRGGAFRKSRFLLNGAEMDAFIRFGVEMARRACAAALAGERAVYPTDGACRRCAYGGVCGFDPECGELRRGERVNSVDDLMKAIEN